MAPINPEELARLSQKIEQGEALTEEEVANIVQGIPDTKKTIDGLYSRTKTAEEEKKKFDGEKQALIKKLEEKSEEKPPASPTPDLSITEVLKLRNEGYSDKEILDLTEHAKGLGVTADKLLTNPVFLEGIKSAREKKKVEGAIPPSTSPSMTVGNKSWDDIALKGTPEEQASAFAEIMRKNSAGGNRSAM